MKFQKWLDEFDSSFLDVLDNYAKYRGGLKLDEKNRKIIIPQGLDKKAVQLYTAYRLEKTNKSLVRATWILTVATIILSELT